MRKLDRASLLKLLGWHRDSKPYSLLLTSTFREKLWCSPIRGLDNNSFVLRNFGTVEIFLADADLLGSERLPLAAKTNGRL